MIGFALYGLALIYTMISHDPIIKHTIKCKYCRQRINEKVREVCVSKANAFLTRSSASVAFIVQAGLMAERSVFTRKESASQSYTMDARIHCIASPDIVYASTTLRVQA